MKIKKIFASTVLFVSIAATGFSEVADGVNTDVNHEPEGAPSIPIVNRPRPVPPLREGSRLAPGRFQRPDEGNLQSLPLRLFEDPETRDQLELDPQVRDALIQAFQGIDEKVDANRMKLVDLQRTQAKLIADNVSEDQVLEAVDAIWKTRGDIAKLQTSKLLKLRGHLTAEQIKKLDQDHQESFRMRRRQPAASYP